MIIQWKQSECSTPFNSFYVLSIGDRQSIISSEKCTLTQPVCEKNVSAIVKLYAVNRVPKSEFHGNCQVPGDFDQLCQEHNNDLLFVPVPGAFLCSEELVTELKCDSFKYLALVYIGIPVSFIFLTIVCLIIARKIMSMRDIKCIPPKGLIEVNENCNEEMYNLVNVGH